MKCLDMRNLVLLVYLVSFLIEMVTTLFGHTFGAHTIPILT
jgi:hypothetical protein